MAHPRMIATLFLVPPVNLLLALLAALAARREALAALAAALLLLLAIPAIAWSLMAPLERGLPTTPRLPPGAIVILSGDQTESLENGHRVFSPGPLTLTRERDGAALARRTGLPILVSGGRIHPSDPPLADTMARSLAEDFHTRVTWTEPGSADTWQNARFSADLLRAHGIGSVWVVTTPWHLRRALLAFRRAGLEATAAPLPLDAPPRLPRALLPEPGAWLRSYWALHEWIGLAWYWVR
jgi:uncharacterized SAM-binding protein YcdF (DUF218 family)